ncbi:MAG: hypothetical protein LZF61_08755 [Nitrosomonas sp.]|nr:MAG: hypothetical protein LZF61_08755 [Nitrosomonas sp.]
MDKSHEGELKQWLRESGIDPESITFFLRNEAFAEARRKAVKDLGLWNKE